MQGNKDFSLKDFNSFSINTSAELFFQPRSEEEIREVLSAHPDVRILGGGSNILFVGKEMKGPLLQVGIMGIERVFDNEEYAIVSAGAGEDWQSLVDFCLEQNLGGIENLTLIPGKVGAAPIQNIGAYGVELKDCFYALEAIEKSTGRLWTFHEKMCKFEYRQSVFKGDKKDQFIITRLFLKLNKKHQVSVSYGGIRMKLNTLGIKEPNIREMAQVVANLRREKLPDPNQLPNAGSFFKNPIVSRELLQGIQKDHPFAPFYELDEEKVKIPAAWLIEQVEFKGFRSGDAGVYDKHALILVNHGNASGQEIYDLSEKIAQAVQAEFGIKLEREVNIFS